jgi:homoserine dehydrogenase
MTSLKERTSKKNSPFPQRIKVGIIGGGTVGMSVHKILSDNSSGNHLLSQIEVVSVAIRDLKKIRSIPQNILTDNPDSLVDDPKIEIVVELMGGIDEAYRLIKRALQNGKHVITANKSLVASHYGNELRAFAARAGVCFKYEASVAGGIPILGTLKTSLGANKLHKTMGIVNGTCNFILTQMSDFDMTFPDALIKAQELGFAEADPIFDVGGRDAAEKNVILSKVTFGKDVDVSQVLADPELVKGITSIESRDIECAKKLGFTIKLLAVSEIKSDGKLLFLISPHLVENKHPLASVKDSYNAIFLEGDPVGDLMLYGQGAGGGPTASAVVGDILNVIEGISSGVPVFSASSTAGSSEFVTLSKEMCSKFYLRLLTQNSPTAFGGIMWLFGEANIAPEMVQQSITDEGLLEIVILTQAVSSQKLHNALRIISGLPYFEKTVNALPLLEAS